MSALIIGVDTHKEIHVAAAVDWQGGALVGKEYFPTTRQGYRQLESWATCSGSEPMITCPCLGLCMSSSLSVRYALHALAEPAAGQDSNGMHRRHLALLGSRTGETRASVGTALSNRHIRGMIWHRSLCGGSRYPTSRCSTRTVRMLPAGFAATETVPHPAVGTASQHPDLHTD